MFQKNDRVLVEIAMLSGQKFPGVVQRRSPRAGFWIVRYESFGGVHFKESFAESKMELAV